MAENLKNGQTSQFAIGNIDKPYGGEMVRVPDVGRANNDLVGSTTQMPKSVEALTSIGPTKVDMANMGMNMVDSVDSSDPKMTAEMLAFMSMLSGEGIVEKIIKAETPAERRYWTYFIMERIVSYNDEWPAKALRESLALKLAGGSEALASLKGTKLTDAEVNRQKGIKESLVLVQDIDKLFDQWFGFYKNIAPSGKIVQMAFNALSEYMPPEFFARVYGEMPGFREGEKEWKSVSEQVDVAIRAFLYLSLQSDPRWEQDLKWYRAGAGFKKLFPNDSTEKEWLYRLKLKTLPNEDSRVAYLYGTLYENLTATDMRLLDSIPAYNRYADANNGGTVKAVMETIQETVSAGKFQNNAAMKMQSEIATNFADKTFRFFGLAAMYGTRSLHVDQSGKTDKVAAEDYPWSDAMTDLTRPKDNITYCEQNSYYAGPLAWRNFAPEHVMVDFMRMVAIRDKDFPESKGKTRSAMELFVEGKTLGEIFKDGDHITDWGYRAYLIRILFSLREDSGAFLAMNGDLVKGKSRESALDAVYWENVEKSIHIVCRDWIITKGKYKEWFEDHKSEVLKIMITRGMSQEKAQDALMKKYVSQEKNRWKAVAFLTAAEANPISENLEAMIETAHSVGYLDKPIMSKVLEMDFSKTAESSNKSKILQQMKSFIDSAVDSVN